MCKTDSNIVHGDCQWRRLCSTFCWQLTIQVTDKNPHKNFTRASYTMAYLDLKQSGKKFIVQQIHRNCKCHCAVEQWLNVGLVVHNTWVWSPLKSCGQKPLASFLLSSPCCSQCFLLSSPRCSQCLYSLVPAALSTFNSLVPTALSAFYSLVPTALSAFCSLVPVAFSA